MNMLDQAISLENCKDLFKDERAFRSFIEMLKAACLNGSAVVFFEGQVICSVLSPGGTKELIYERFMKKLSQKPELLVELADRLENDEIVE